MTTISTISALQIDGATIHCLAHHTESVIFAQETEFQNVPPRTIVRIALSTVARSCSNMEIWLPDPENWNGRFVALGNGGSAGGINNLAFIEPLKSGYAVATSDMGTAPDSDSGIDNPEVWKDFGFRATHLMTSTAKTIIAAFYTRPPSYSYFIGGSTGGQQALQEAQRYPDDYDGIVALVPAHCRTPLHAYFLWNAQILQRCPFTEEQEQNVIKAAQAYFAKRQATSFAGTLIADPRCNEADIEAVLTLAQNTDNSLSTQHLDALRQIFTGPRHSKSGAHIFDGVPLGSTFSNATGHLYVFQWAFGKDVDMHAINFHSDIETYSQLLAPHLNAENPDLHAFKQHGGKLIIASGSADSIVPYHSTLDYYERVMAKTGNLIETQSFCRFFLLPGKDHGGNGPGINKLPNMLELIRAWREQDIAVEELQCQREQNGKILYTVPIFPYPLCSKQDEQGNWITVETPRGGVGRVAGEFLTGIA